MIIKCYAIWDDKAQAFLPPFFMANDPMAVRVLTDCVRDPKHQFGAHPEDYTLFRLGKFDDATGLFDVPTVPENLMSCRELAARQKKVDDRQLSFVEGK